MGVAEAAAGEIVEGVVVDVGFRELGEVDVAGDCDGVMGFVFFEEAKEAFLFVGDIAPILHSFFVGDHLDAAGDDAEVGRNLQLGFEPFPLGFSKQSFGSVLGGAIPSDSAAVFFCSWDQVAEVAGVEDEDLAGLSFFTEGVGGVDALACASW